LSRPRCRVSRTRHRSGGKGTRRMADRSYREASRRSAPPARALHALVYAAARR
jgi:hypothetical protein